MSTETPGPIAPEEEHEAARQADARDVLEIAREIDNRLSMQRDGCYTNTPAARFFIRGTDSAAALVYIADRKTGKEYRAHIEELELAPIQANASADEGPSPDDISDDFFNCAGCHAIAPQSDAQRAGNRKYCPPCHEENEL